MCVGSFYDVVYIYLCDSAPKAWLKVRWANQLKLALSCHLTTLVVFNQRVGVSPVFDVLGLFSQPDLIGEGKKKV